MGFAHMQVRWIIAAVGWGTLAAALPMQNGGDALWSLYPECLELLHGRTSDLLPTLTAFAVATVAVGASPLLLLASYSRNPTIRALRWFGWAAMLCAPVVAFLIAHNGWWHGFVMLGIAHVIIGAAVVPWPDERRANRGFDVLLEATDVAEPQNDASPKA